MAEAATIPPTDIQGADSIFGGDGDDLI